MTAIEKGNYTFVVLKNDSKDVMRFLWLEEFENAELLQNNFANYKGKRVRISYIETSPLYHAKTNSYQKYKRILSFKVIDK